MPGGALWAIEIKRSLDPRPRRGFHVACAHLKPERRFGVYAGAEAVRLADKVQVMPLAALAAEVSERSQ